MAWITAGVAIVILLTAWGFFYNAGQKARRATYEARRREALRRLFGENKGDGM